MQLWGTDPENKDRIRLHEFAKMSAHERAQIIFDLNKIGEYRCLHCGRPLFIGKLGIKSNIQAKCQNSRCKHLNVISTTES